MEKAPVTDGKTADVVSAESFAPPEMQYPGPTVPCITVDAIPNSIVIGNVVRFYLAKFDPEVFGRNSPPKVTPVIQVAMPIMAFATSVLFLNDQLEKLESDKTIKEMIAPLREIVAKLKQQNARPAGEK